MHYFKWTLIVHKENFEIAFFNKILGPTCIYMWVWLLEKVHKLYKYKVLTWPKSFFPHTHTNPSVSMVTLNSPPEAKWAICLSLIWVTMLGCFCKIQVNVHLNSSLEFSYIKQHHRDVIILHFLSSFFNLFVYWTVFKSCSTFQKHFLNSKKV